MKHTPAIRAWVIAGLFGLAAAGITYPASANTINLIGFDESTNVADVTCDNGLINDCSGLINGDNDATDVPVGLATLSNTDAHAYNIGEPEADIAAALSTLTGMTFTKDDVTKGTPTSLGNDMWEFAVETPWVALKAGNLGTWFLRNNAGFSTMTVFYDQIANGAGLSFFAAIVPVPATLPLFLTGLLGLGFLARRRRQALEA